MDVDVRAGRGDPHGDLLQVHAHSLAREYAAAGLELLGWYTDPDGLFALSLAGPAGSSAAGAAMLELFPEPARGAAEDAYARARAEGERAPPGRPYVVANMVATVDGRAALGGRTEAHLERRPTGSSSTRCASRWTP